jgi:hypothetical protein
MRSVLLFLAIPILFFLSCAKEKSYELGQDGSLDFQTSWQFKDTSILFNGNAVSYKLDETGTEMDYVGTSKDLLGTIQIRLISAMPLKQGVYRSENGEVEFSYMSGGTLRYEADIDSVGEKLMVTIVSIDSLSVVGFFTGTVRNPAGVVVPVTEGKFNYRKAASGGGDSASEGTLGSAADTCTGAAISGVYKKLVPLDATNTVSVNVNVTKVGAYTIGTDTVNGFYFTKTASFTATGAQTVILNGVGAPIDSGLTNFKVKYGASTCGFSIKVDSSNITPPVGDYQPLGTNSNWSYDKFDATGSLADTTYGLVTGAVVAVNGKNYNIIKFEDSNGLLDTSFIRKEPGNYYTVVDLDLNFGTGGRKEALQLKDNVAVGSTWNNDYDVTPPGVPGTLTGRLTHTILEKAVPVTLDGITYPDVIKVKIEAFTVAAGSAVLMATQEAWYARGVGLIYSKVPTIIPTVFTETKLRRYQIF